MTSAELYALDFAKMDAAERAAFRDELIEKPGHGPMASPREHRIYAEAHARWSDWVKDHPEDDVAEDASPSSSSGQREAASGGSTQGGGRSQSNPGGPQQRPDGTSPRRQLPQGTGL
jgi:hypothetical protein